jgi:hypothetical protein
LSDEEIVDDEHDGEDTSTNGVLMGVFTFARDVVVVVVDLFSCAGSIDDADKMDEVEDEVNFEGVLFSSSS